jgi:methionyl-tRNA formyltransferase
MVGRSLTVVFFGTPEFAVPTLDAVLSSHHSCVGVVTQPDRPRGRGQKITYAPVKKRALEAGLPVLQPPSLKSPEFLRDLHSLGSDIGVVAAYGKILPQTVITAPPLGMVNVHASLLPRYRGAAPVHRAVLAGEHETGVTIMRIVQALDAGPMLATVRRPIDNEETSVGVEQDLARLGATLLVATLDELAADNAREVVQDESTATYAPRLTKEDGLIDWMRPAADIHNAIRGLYPWPHAYTFIGPQRLILLRSSLAGTNPEVPPGTIVHASGDWLSVATGLGLLSIHEVQLEGKRPMHAREFLAGHRIEGRRFATSP